MQLSFKTKGESRGFVVIEEIASVYVDNYKSKMTITLKSGKDITWEYPPNNSMEEDYNILIDIIIPDEDV